MQDCILWPNEHGFVLLARFVKWYAWPTISLIFWACLNIFHTAWTTWTAETTLKQGLNSGHYVPIVGKLDTSMSLIFIRNSTRLQKVTPITCQLQTEPVLILPKTEYPLTIDHSQILPILHRYVIPLTVNPYGTWVLNACHVRACMKKLRIEVPEDCIEMPVQEVRGPMPSDEGKEFLVHITVNISYITQH